MSENDRIFPDEGQLEEIARKKAACPFMGPAVRHGRLAVFGDIERPLASIKDIADLGDLGGGDLGRRVLRIFATGNQRRVPGPSGRFDEASPDGMMSLDLAGSQGSHPGHSGIMLGDPSKLDAGRFSRDDFDRLAGHADADGRLGMEAVGEFIAENLARDPEARVLPVAGLAGGLFGVADEVFDNLRARLLGRKNWRTHHLRPDRCARTPKKRCRNRSARPAWPLRISGSHHSTTIRGSKCLETPFRWP